ncbi:MAG: hypothetical protein H6741_19795 [Alphaproteobacteria bacterium]|nr:hypothetical protein [Alphaproteobacteria bacterium]MCB9794949.1 hypothetical protein [Alphaproteobacteria bacterium]
MLTEAQILSVWERSEGRSALEFALLALREAFPAEPAPEALPLRARDTRLFALREALFGGLYHFELRCPRCEAELEFETDAEPLRPDAEAPEALEFELGGRMRRLREPSSQDLLQAGRMGSVAAARRRLTELCCLDGGPIDEALEQAFSQALPGVTAVELACEACGHAWTQPFDVADYLRAELSRRAGRSLREVLELARALGWSESEILAMSPARRARYLAMAGR